MKRLQIGTALPETALILATALIVLFGASHMAIIAFTQAAADGASFVGAHALAINPAASAPSVIQTIFPQFATTDIAAPGSATNFQSQTVSKTVDGFPMLKTSASYTISGSDIELKPQGAGQAPQAFSFAASATLQNFCDLSKTCNTPTTRSVWLAQTVDTSGNGQGWNGPFKEWRCHQAAFASLKFPSSRPASLGTYDWRTKGSSENTIYNWDSGSHTC